MENRLEVAKKMGATHTYKVTGFETTCGYTGYRIPDTRRLFYQEKITQPDQPIYI